MPRISREESTARRDEVIDACAALYDTRSYHDITMAQIADSVSFGRANIYNYFSCKDEVMLALLQREHERWADDLDALAARAALEALVGLKRAYGCALASLRGVLAAARPAWDGARMERFTFAFMPFLHGVHPYAFHTEKQLEAMRKVGIASSGLDVRDMVRSMALQLLEDK